MHASNTLRFLALFGAVSMFAATLPADAQYYNRYRTSRQARHFYRANPHVAAAVFPGDTLGRINDAYARGLITAEQANGLTLQYNSAVINDQRFGGSLHMNALEQNLDQAIYAGRGFRF